MRYTPEQVFQFASPEWEQQPLLDVEQKVATSDDLVKVRFTVSVEVADLLEAEHLTERMRDLIRGTTHRVDNFSYSVEGGGM